MAEFSASGSPNSTCLLALLLRLPFLLPGYPRQCLAAVEASVLACSSYSQPLFPKFWRLVFSPLSSSPFILLILLHSPSAFSSPSSSRSSYSSSAVCLMLGAAPPAVQPGIPMAPSTPNPQGSLMSRFIHHISFCLFMVSPVAYGTSQARG